MTIRCGLLAFAIGAALTGSAAPGFSAAIWDESGDGDLSSDRFDPTDFGSLPTGTSSITATTVTGDLEYFTFTIDSGLQLQSIILTSYISEDDRSFIAVQSGSTFTEPAPFPATANLLGWTHFGTAPGHVGTDILDDIGAGALSIGFTPPLASGSYTFMIQETGALSASYTLGFVVVPEPSPAALFGLALARFPARRREPSRAAIAPSTPGAACRRLRAARASVERRG